MAELTHVEGKNAGTIVLYALSTCVWCMKTRRLLDDLKLEYDYMYVDLLDSEENARIKDDIRQWNPRCTFPAIKINDDACIIGFNETKIRELVR